MSLSNPTTTTLDLAWAAAAGATSYRLAWTESGAGGRTWTSFDGQFGAGRRGVTLTNLLPGRTYTVRVTPMNSAGTRDDDHPHRQHQEGDPPPAGCGVLDEPVQPDHHHPRPGLGRGRGRHQLPPGLDRERRRPSTWTSFDGQFGAGRRGVTLTNLLPGRTYTVRVTQMNSAGTGTTTTRTGSTTG